LYILIFTFLDSRWEDKNFRTQFKVSHKRKNNNFPGFELKSSGSGFYHWTLVGVFEFAPCLVVISWS
jgi:hypothetical protein